MVKTVFILLAFSVVLMSAFVSGASSAGLLMDWYVVGSGNGNVTSGGFALIGVIGQPVVGSVSMAGLRHDIGFLWGEAASRAIQVGNLREAKLLCDGTEVSVSARIVTTDATDFTGFFYVEDPDRTSGIRIEPTIMPVGLERGRKVDMTGTMMTTPSGERYIGAAGVAIQPDK